MVIGALVGDGRVFVGCFPLSEILPKSNSGNVSWNARVYDKRLASEIGISASMTLGNNLLVLRSS